MKNANGYTEKQLEREMKIAHFKVYWANKFNNAKKWVVDNKELVIVMGPVVVGGAVSLGKSLTRGVTRTINNRKEDELKNLYCYDRSLGHYWKLRRQLTNSEWVKIDKRKANGERLADILEDLRVLK